ncbi:hypothetical protein, partial [Klebsiella pneumoniae]|uniref:hypothetical protein n=1 Tax=Klebsiella pneumoniae TaxID=573 RepID=UPI001B3C1798
EWVHVQLHQQKGMISLSPPTICNSATCIHRFSPFPFILRSRFCFPGKKTQKIPTGMTHYSVRIQCKDCGIVICEYDQKWSFAYLIPESGKCHRMQETAIITKLEGLSL